VAVSTDDFNQKKNKKSLIPFEQRMEIISSLRCVDEVIEERSWQQKSEDIQKLGISVFGMGSDWRGHFDYLSQYCEVVYLDRTQGVSSTIIRNSIKNNTSI
jgi:glycerol-3-phosphate cytidylyltransferase